MIEFQRASRKLLEQLSRKLRQPSTQAHGSLEVIAAAMAACMDQGPEHRAKHYGAVQAMVGQFVAEHGNRQLQREWQAGMVIKELDAAFEHDQMAAAYASGHLFEGIHAVSGATDATSLTVGASGSGRACHWFLTMIATRELDRAIDADAPYHAVKIDDRARSALANRLGYEVSDGLAFRLANDAPSGVAPIRAMMADAILRLEGRPLYVRGGTVWQQCQAVSAAMALGASQIVWQPGNDAQARDLYRFVQAYNRAVVQVKGSDLSGSGDAQTRWVKAMAVRVFAERCKADPSFDAMGSISQFIKDLGLRAEAAQAVRIALSSEVIVSIQRAAALVQLAQSLQAPTSVSQASKQLAQLEQDVAIFMRVVDGTCDTVIPEMKAVIQEAYDAVEGVLKGIDQWAGERYEEESLSCLLTSGPMPGDDPGGQYANLIERVQALRANIHPQPPVHHWVDGEALLDCSDLRARLEAVEGRPPALRIHPPAPPSDPEASPRPSG